MDWRYGPSSEALGSNPSPTKKKKKGYDHVITKMEE
jgi:hypothetical protein